jgi:cell division protein FtsW
MSDFRSDRVLSKQSIDLPLLGMALLLAGSGLSVLYSASYGFASRLFGDPTRFLTQQSVFVAIGLALCLIVSVIRTETLRSSIKWVTLAALAAQLLPFAPVIGGEMNGAHRWIFVFGRSFQPSEMLKPVLILYLAHILDKKGYEEKGADVLNGLLPPLLISAAGTILVFMQNDLSGAAIVAFIAFVMFWISGIPLRFFAAFVTVCLPLGLLSVITSEFRLHRIISFVLPDYDTRGISYQMMCSLRAVRSGGAFGKGIGFGTLKLASIPEVQSDFVFSAFAEEAGFVGVVAFLGAWAWFIWRSYRVSFKCLTPFARYLAFGVSTSLCIQVLINLSVVGGFIPATGIVLPFFSQGGTSIMMSLASIGLVLNVSRDAKRAEGEVHA